MLYSKAFDNIKYCQLNTLLKRDISPIIDIRIHVYCPNWKVHFIQFYC